MPSIARFIDRFHPLLITMALAVTVLQIATLGPGSLDRIVTVATLNMLLAIGIYVFSGTSGVITFGQLAFAAVGAYTAGLMRIPPEQKEQILPELPGFILNASLSETEAILLAGGVAAAAAAILAIPLMRLSGLSAGLASLALLFIALTTARAWDDVTRGVRGLSAVPRGIPPNTALYWMLAMMALVFLYQITRRGLRLMSSREDEVAASSIGVNVGLERGISFVLSGFIMGVGGGLYVIFLGAINPRFFFISLTFLIITMMVIGGFNSLAGAVVGAIVVSVISDVLRRAETGDLFGIDLPSRLGFQDLILAALLFLMILARPEGITKGREFVVGPIHRWAKKFEHRPLVEPKPETPTPRDDAA